VRSCHQRTDAKRAELDHFLLLIATMLVPFPHRYSATLSRTFASRVQMDAPPRLVLTGGPSPELASDVNARSPEHMLLSSLGLSMLTTFEAFAARDRIKVMGWNAKVSGTVEQTPEGRMFTSIVLELDIELEGNLDRLETTLEDTKQYCLVLNSMRVPVVIETTVRTPDEIVEDVPHSYDLRQLTPRDSRRDASRWESLEQCQVS
jgi:uncharacterized OsmC-like protein